MDKVYGHDENMNRHDVNSKGVFTKLTSLSSDFTTNSQVPVAIPDISFKLTTHRKSCID
jgi:hypothetical protein